MARRLGPLGRPRWLDEGEPPDYRFSLANERTFLAWIRTALALLAGAVAVTQFVPHLAGSTVRTILAVLLAIGAAVLGATAYVRWAGNERAMRLRAELPFTRTILALSAALVVVSGVVAVLLIVDAS